MSVYSKEFLFRECVLHHHCILLRLYHTIKWDDKEVHEIYMIDIRLDDREKKLMLDNITNSINTYGNIKINAFINYEEPTNTRMLILSTDDIYEIELRNTF